MLAVGYRASPRQPAASSLAGQGYTLTVVVEGVNNLGGNVGLLVFNSPKGWAEDRSAALKDITVPAHEGTDTITFPVLPAGEYAVALVHDVNKNHKLDKNFAGRTRKSSGACPTIRTPSSRRRRTARALSN